MSYPSHNDNHTQDCTLSTLQLTRVYLICTATHQIVPYMHCNSPDCTLSALLLARGGANIENPKFVWFCVNNSLLLFSSTSIKELQRASDQSENVWKKNVIAVCFNLVKIRICKVVAKTFLHNLMWHFYRSVENTNRQAPPCTRQAWCWWCVALYF